MAEKAGKFCSLQSIFHFVLIRFIGHVNFLFGEIGGVTIYAHAIQIEKF